MVVTSILLVSSTVLRNKGISGNFSFILLQNICHIFGENNEIVEHETGRIFKILAISCLSQNMIILSFSRMNGTLANQFNFGFFPD